MLTPDRLAIAALGFLACAATPLAAAESIGKAVQIKTLVTGASGELSTDDAVYQDERIRTSKSGLGQFLFRDGTKLAVGWGSSVVIDNFVFDGSRSVKKLTVQAAKGTFRWVSGNSKHSAYEILTPAGTIGVRGTAFDFYVGPDGTTAVVLLNGAATFCGAGGCRQLTRRCDCVVAKPNGGLSETSRVNRGIFKTLGNNRALPFLSGNQTLAAGVGSGGCGLASAANMPRDDIAPRELRKERPVPTKPDDKPDEEKPTPDPEKPHHHHHHDRDHGHHDRDHGKHDRDHGKHDRPHHDRDKPDRPHDHHGHHDKGDYDKDDRGKDGHGDRGHGHKDRHHKEKNG